LPSKESPRDGIALWQLEDALIAAGAPAQKAAEAAEEVADVVELLHRMERRLVRVEVLIGFTLGRVGLVAAGVLATVLKIYLG
jgi:hypothetical protein